MILQLLRALETERHVQAPLVRALDDELTAHMTLERDALLAGCDSEVSWKPTLDATHVQARRWMERLRSASNPSAVQEIAREMHAAMKLLIDREEHEVLGSCRALRDPQEDEQLGERMSARPRPTPPAPARYSVPARPH